MQTCENIDPAGDGYLSLSLTRRELHAISILKAQTPTLHGLIDKYEAMEEFFLVQSILEMMLELLCPPYNTELRAEFLPIVAQIDVGIFDVYLACDDNALALALDIASSCLRLALQQSRIGVQPNMREKMKGLRRANWQKSQSLGPLRSYVRDLALRDWAANPDLQGNMRGTAVCIADHVQRWVDDRPKLPGLNAWRSFDRADPAASERRLHRLIKIIGDLEI